MKLVCSCWGTLNIGRFVQADGQMNVMENPNFYWPSISVLVDLKVIFSIHTISRFNPDLALWWPKMSQIGSEIRIRTTNPNPAVPNSTRECWSIFQHWLHFGPFFFKRSNANYRIRDLLTGTLFHVIGRSSNDSSHNIYRTGKCNSAMMVPHSVYFQVQ